MEDQQPSPTKPVASNTDAGSPTEAPMQDGLPPSTPFERVPEERAAVTTPLAPEEPYLVPEPADRSTTRQPATPHPWRALTRRQLLTGVGLLVGAAAIGTGTTVVLLADASAPGSSSASSPGPASTSTAGTLRPPPMQTPVSESTLQAWRTKQMTVQPSQRFKHHTGTALVPLGVVEPTYPNPYNPYTIHLQGYVLGGVLVAGTQFFLYLGLASLDGSQFVAKVRVGPVNQTSKTFGLLVVQQSTDDIEGGPAEFPQVTLAPRAIYQALPALSGHCIEVVFIRQPLPKDQDAVPAGMVSEVNQQAKISDQFLQVDYEAIHHTPLAQMPASTLDPIRYLLDDSSITYSTASNADQYPLVTQLILRQSDQLYPKLIAGSVASNRNIGAGPWKIDVGTIKERVRIYRDIEQT